MIMHRACNVPCNNNSDVCLKFVLVCIVGMFTQHPWIHTALIKGVFWDSLSAPMGAVKAEAPWLNVHQSRLRGRAFGRCGAVTEVGNRDDLGRAPVGICQRRPHVKGERRPGSDGV